jgi:hypothetical protein
MGGGAWESLGTKAEGKRCRRQCGNVEKLVGCCLCYWKKRVHRERPKHVIWRIGTVLPSWGWACPEFPLLAPRHFFRHTDSGLKKILSRCMAYYLQFPVGSLTFQMLSAYLYCWVMVEGNGEFEEKTRVTCHAVPLSISHLLGGCTLFRRGWFSRNTNLALSLAFYHAL